MSKAPFVKFWNGGRRVAVNRAAVLYVYELEADQCAIVVGTAQGDERVVAVDGGLDEVTDKLDADGQGGSSGQADR